MVKKTRINETADAPDDATDEKLQKVLARAGCGSRREMERAIVAGEVQVNGKLATLGDRVSPEDTIVFRGKELKEKGQKSRRRVILYNKPEGEICSRQDPEGRRTVYAALPKLSGERWISVGRLDFNTSGLLLFTNDGDLANKLMHPSSVIDREYLVRIQGDVDEDMKKRLLDGVLLDDGLARFTDIVDGAGESRNRWFYCVVMEGRNREVRRLWESQGVRVSRLKRVRYGNIFIPSHVRVGQWLELNDKEIADLCLTAGLDVERTAPALPDEKKQRERHERKLRAGRAGRGKRNVRPRGPAKS
ncbi:pseudouridine synthase [Gilvimarinus sp. DA14]|uniref:pseudouridine synthase n=1 Tax=Gilvimarinus sp. DA14 TaxID=2956798 RepID=UPI0020B6ABF9|nr:pseudouridine synthase [Gilvimarinus sp. DA14]UTF60963.1 pseudouridine synthase [Gilvimarinus sp. DA14]